MFLMTWMHFLAYSIPISSGRKKNLEKNESFEIYTAISN